MVLARPGCGKIRRGWTPPSQWHLRFVPSRPSSSSAYLAFLEALNLALKSPAPPASLEADVITAEQDDDRPFGDAAPAAAVAALPSERALFRRELRLARNPNMAKASELLPAAASKATPPPFSRSLLCHAKWSVFFRRTFLPSNLPSSSVSALRARTM